MELILGVVRPVRFVVFFFQAEDGIRDLVRSRGLGDVYKRQVPLSETIVYVLVLPAASVPRARTLEPLSALVVMLSLIHI